MSEDCYQVVVRSADGLDEEHADLIRQQLVDTGFKPDAVSVQPVEVEVLGDGA